MQRRIVALQSLVFGLLLCPVNGQWVNYPTAGVPPTRDGKPDLAAACPRTAEGKPDFSGLWIIASKREGNPNFPGCEPVSDEFVNIAASLKEGLPYQTWAADLVKARRSEQRVNDPISNCLPMGPVRLHTWNGPRKVVQIPGLLVFMSEFETAGYLEQLQALGIDVVNTVKIQNNVHNKGIIVDDTTVLVSSQNWSAAGTLQNRDAGVIITHPDAATYYANLFLHDWNNLATRKVGDD